MRSLPLRLQLVFLSAVSIRPFGSEILLLHYYQFFKIISNHFKLFLTCDTPKVLHHLLFPNNYFIIKLYSGCVESHKVRVYHTISNRVHIRVFRKIERVEVEVLGTKFVSWQKYAPPDICFPDESCRSISNPISSFIPYQIL